MLPGERYARARRASGYNDYGTSFSHGIHGRSIAVKALILPRVVSLDEVDAPLELVDLPVPEPGPGEVVRRITACGVCHTELDEIEGRALPPRLPIVPGHEVVGIVARQGEGATRHAVGDRVGVG